MSRESRIVELRDGWARIRVHQFGGGRPLVFLPGVGGLPADDSFLELLGEHFRVHAVMLPGFEDSEVGEGLETVLDFTLLVFDVVDALGLTRPVLAGHSFGGMIAAEMAAIAPNEVEHLVLLSAMGLWNDAHPVPDLFATLPFELPDLMLHDAEIRGDLVSAGGDLNDPEFLTVFLVENARRMGTVGKLLFPVPDRGLCDRLYRIAAQTLIVWGRSDRFMDLSYAQSFANAIRTARVELLEDAGHMVPYEQPQRVVGLLREFVSAG